MQKRLKTSIWPDGKPVPATTEPTSSLEKINQLRKAIPQVGYIRQALLIPHILPVSPATLWRWVSTGKFPKPVKISTRITAWRVADVIDWLASHE
jgi:hypothetical protein